MGFQKELQDFYISLQLQIKPNHSIEIGPREGTYSNRMKSICDKNNIWAFEANPHVYNKFKSDHEDINYLNLAVFDKETELEFKLQKGFDYTVGNNSFLTRKSGIQFKLNGQNYVERLSGFDIVKVNSIVIDEYFKNKLFSEDKISMWIDVEGASEQVLSGCIQTLKQTHSVFIEVEHEQFWEGQWLFDDVMNFFTQNDFLLLARDFEWYEKVVRQENLIFVNRNYLYN
jgi:FkbM family methyltransferase